MVCRRKTGDIHGYSIAVLVYQRVSTLTTTRDVGAASDLGCRGWFVFSVPEWGAIWNLRILKNHKESVKRKIRSKLLGSIHNPWFSCIETGCVLEMSLFFEHNSAKTLQKNRFATRETCWSDYLSADMFNQNPWSGTFQALMNYGISKLTTLEIQKKPPIERQTPPVWRIIPYSKWLITMVIVSPPSRVIPLPNGLNGL